MCRKISPARKWTLVAFEGCMVLVTLFYLLRFVVATRQRLAARRQLSPHLTMNLAIAQFVTCITRLLCEIIFIISVERHRTIAVNLLSTVAMLSVFANIGVMFAILTIRLKVTFAETSFKVSESRLLKYRLLISGGILISMASLSLWWIPIHDPNNRKRFAISIVDSVFMLLFVIVTYVGLFYEFATRLLTIVTNRMSLLYGESYAPPNVQLTNCSSTDSVQRRSTVAQVFRKLQTLSDFDAGSRKTVAAVIRHCALTLTIGAAFLCHSTGWLIARYQSPKKESTCFGFGTLLCYAVVSVGVLVHTLCTYLSFQYTVDDYQKMCGFQEYAVRRAVVRHVVNQAFGPGKPIYQLM